MNLRDAVVDRLRSILDRLEYEGYREDSTAVVEVTALAEELEEEEW